MMPSNPYRLSFLGIVLGLHSPSLDKMEVLGETEAGRACVGHLGRGSAEEINPSLSPMGIP